MNEPRDEVELALVAAWQQLLGAERISLEDNFFDIGGDSLAALDLVALIESDFGIELPVVELFDSPTVGTLAEVVRQGVAGRPLGPLVNIRRGSEAALPLYLFPAASGMLYFFHPIARCLPESQPVWGLQSRGLRKGEAMLSSVAEMVAEALPFMKDAHPGGPWQLIGYSLGGLLAHEAACQLSDAGEEVAWA
ncbi:MAG TPA: alpha/beta fold hydrolase, partial [Acidimicrobiales bacterium]|nr:alpha/beta fold hydrolase [Acidimicrobiales bacterium]